MEPVGSLTGVWILIMGIPPKWIDWDTMREVALSVGLMVEVDWQTLFNNFFSTVRVKIQCRDPTRVPRRRVFVFQKELFLITFKVEGFDQVSNPSDPDNDGEVEELEDEELAGNEDGNARNENNDANEEIRLEPPLENNVNGSYGLKYKVKWT